MKPKIYNFDTPFDFGKHKGRTLIDVLNLRDEKYIGYLIRENILQVVLDPATLEELDHAGYFDNLEFPCYVKGGSIPIKTMGYEKEDIINEFKRRYDEFVKNPKAYEKDFKKRRREFLMAKRDKSY